MMAHVSIWLSFLSIITPTVLSAPAPQSGSLETLGTAVTALPPTATEAPIEITDPNQIATFVVHPENEECTGTIAECIPICALDPKDPLTWYAGGGEIQVMAWLQNNGSGTSLMSRSSLLTS
jgi:hypothetical protein